MDRYGRQKSFRELISRDFKSEKKMENNNQRTVTGEDNDGNEVVVVVKKQLPVESGETCGRGAVGG